jgi:hypothetical protein
VAVCVTNLVIRYQGLSDDTQRPAAHSRMAISGGHFTKVSIARNLTSRTGRSGSRRREVFIRKCNLSCRRRIPVEVRILRVATARALSVPATLQKTFFQYLLLEKTDRLRGSTVLITGADAASGGEFFNINHDQDSHLPRAE